MEGLWMIELKNQIYNYLDYCRYQKNLNTKTLKAYNIDLEQFIKFTNEEHYELNRSGLSYYISLLHKNYRPKSVKRKIASLKAFCCYLEYEELIEENPFARMKVKFQEPFILPKTIPINIIQLLFKSAYHLSVQMEGETTYQYYATLRDVAVLELLFASGIRVSELCSLNLKDVDLDEGTIKIYGKGSKERIVQIENASVLAALKSYKNAFKQKTNKAGYFFVNRLNKRLSEQSVRMMINKYVELAGVATHITPHMFRHSFATLLLEEDVDIRYIQQLLGHSSIVTTQIYTHVASSKQRNILALKHPRNKIQI
jgi:site-specific recombinase XerD